MQPRRNRNLQSSLFLCEKTPKTPRLGPPDDYSKLEEALHVDFSNKNWYIITGLVERPRSIFGEEVPRLFCGESLEGTKCFHR